MDGVGNGEDEYDGIVLHNFVVWGAEDVGSVTM